MVDCYSVLAMVVLSVGLFVNPYSKLSMRVATYLMIEKLVRTLAVVFVDRYTMTIRSPARSTILLGVGYLELIVGFAILYLHYNCIEFSEYKNIVVEAWDALYFSAVTITTLGYGDIRPASMTGRILVILEILSGLIVIVYALSMFILSSDRLKVHGER